MVNPRVIIIGAGMSGLLMGIKLREAGIESFEILEMADAVGGTWRDNTYPGLACDVPAHGYAYSFEPNWKWKGLYAEGAEIRAYFEHCADKYGIRPFVRFNTMINRIEREDGGWSVTSTDGMRRRADVVVTCIGGLVHPKYPEIKGLDSFSGAKFHSARWDHSVELANKRVGVIGTGSTAIQITSALAGKASHYSLFQRTPQWVSRNFEMRRPAWIRTLQRWFPWLASASGRFQNMLTEQTFSRAVIGDARRMRLVEYLVQSNLDKVKDPQLKAKLTPDYRVGCKRLIFSDTFYDAIQRPGASLVTEGISHIEPRGVVTRDGRLHELDVLVMATGFHALDYTRNMTIIGDNGRTLAETWAQGPKGHRAVGIAGFPNLFTVVGPHSPVGNYALTGISEYQIGYIMSLIRMFQRGECRTAVPKPQAQALYNNSLRDGLKNTVWTSGCASWYLDASGLPNLYPFTPSQYRREMQQPQLEEFELTL